MHSGATRHGPACFWCYRVLWEGRFVVETAPCGLGVLLPGACGDGARKAGAMMPRSATPGAKRCRVCHGFSTALLKLWGGAQGQPGPQQPGKTHVLPAAAPREGVALLQGAPYPQPGGPSSAPALRPAPAPGFQNHSALDRQAIQPIRSRKASAQRSLSTVGQSASLDPYIPPSEDKLWLGPAAILSVAEVPLRLGVPFLIPASLLSPRPHRGALTRGAASPAGPLRAAERFPGGGKTVWLPHAGLSAPS